MYSLKKRRIILRCSLAPGDIVMLTAAVRDLHHNNPGAFETDVRTFYPHLWEGNLYLTPLKEGAPGVEVIDCEYPLIHRSNTGPWHFIHGFHQFLRERLRVPLEPTHFKGDIPISRVEKERSSQVAEMVGEEIPFWIIAAGGKRDFTIKWWDTRRFQEVVDHFKGKILFVQIGEQDDHHPPLDGVVDLRGATDLRQLVRLVYHSQGVLCPVTMVMHLAAAIEVKAGSPKNRACVVVAGGREPVQWEAYPHHQYLHTNGALLCCDNGGCWKSRTVALGDGDARDEPEQLCVDVVSRDLSVSGGVGTGAGPEQSFLPRCMDMIKAADVIRRVELYFAGGAARFLNENEAILAQRVAK